MSNIIFNFDELFLSIGIDVAADFSWMSIALPNQTFVGKPFKILHYSIDSLELAASKIKEAEELFLWKVITPEEHQTNYWKAKCEVAA